MVTFGCEWKILEWDIHNRNAHNKSPFIVSARWRVTSRSVFHFVQTILTGTGISSFHWHPFYLWNEKDTFWWIIWVYSSICRITKLCMCTISLFFQMHSEHILFCKYDFQCITNRKLNQSNDCKLYERLVFSEYEIIVPEILSDIFAFRAFSWQ